MDEYFNFNKNDQNQHTQQLISMLNTKHSRKILTRLPSLLTQNKYTLTEINDQISFTPLFYEIIQEKLANKPKNHFLRIQILAGQGCEGFTYKFKFDDQLQDHKDYVKTCLQISTNKQTGIDEQTDRVLFAVDGQDLKFLKGATIDFAQELMREVFYVKENPNAEIECSCKTSFSPKEGLL